MKKVYLFLLFVWMVSAARAQSPATLATSDSTTAVAKANYNQVSGMHRFLFGENYRKEWAAPTRFPQIKISEIKGGLTPTERGGGHQTRSIRLKDKSGREWVLRSIEKYPEVLIPESMRETFARDWLNDNMSAQHPYSALMIPVLAEAARVPHTNPIIGYVYPDEKLGEFKNDFAGTLCLLEEREPEGDSDNTEKMLEKLQEDNDNRVDSAMFFRARLLDLFIADWDRHEDQWRWVDKHKGEGKYYWPVPRDRDDALFVNEGLLPKIAAGTNFLAFLKGFDGKINDVNAFFYNGRKLDQQFLTQFTYEQWMGMTREFVSAMTDAILEKSVAALPASSVSIRQAELIEQLKIRRGNMLPAMDKYYRFINRIVDIKTSDKAEMVEITDDGKKGLLVSVHKLSKNGKKEQSLFSKTFDPDVTDEIRFFIGKGDDSIRINNASSDIKLRIVGGGGSKLYRVEDAARSVDVYESKDNARFEGKTSRLHKHLSNDSLNTAYVNTNLYNITAPLVSVAYNDDDGILLGFGYLFKREGFRKEPFGSVQRISLAHSLSTGTFRIRYAAEWFKISPGIDFVLNAIANVPNNNLNFFGSGNESVLVKSGDYERFYRTRFDSYQVDPALRFHTGKKTALTIGPSFQYYHFDPKENADRFIANTREIKSYDSLTVNKSKQHAGIVLSLESDGRNDEVLPTRGIYLNLRLHGYTGLNDYSKSFAQFFPQVAGHFQFGKNSPFVFSDRLGAGVTIGKQTYYQSAFLGGHDNLLGYRQYRFAGRHMVYNNLEMRIKLAKVASYILPGQLGLLGFFDTGRVWDKNENSDKWHHGTGGGIYFAPVQKILLKGILGYSEEGWYPYFNLGFRF